MEKYLELTKDEIVMGFVASCIEDVAKRLNEPFVQQLFFILVIGFENDPNAGFVATFMSREFRS